jgi:hypothetical protein
MINRNCICIIFKTRKECGLFYTKSKKFITNKNFSLCMKMYMNIYFNMDNHLAFHFDYILIYNKKTKNVMLCLLTEDIKNKIKECIIYNDAETFFNSMEITPTYEPKKLVYE